MADNSGTLESIGVVLGRLLSPLEERLSQGQVVLLMAELGMEFPPEIETKAGFTTSLGKTISSAKLLIGSIADVATAVKDENTVKIISEGIELIQVVVSLIQNIDETATSLKNVGPLPGIVPGDLTAFANALPTKLLDFLVIRNLEGVIGLAEALEFIGAIEREDKTSGTLQYVDRKLAFDKLSQFIQSPGQRLQEMYKWGGTDFDGLALLQKVEKFLVSNGFPAILDTSGPLPILDAVFIEISAKTDIEPKGLQVKITAPIGVENSAPFTQDNFTVEFMFNGQLIPGAMLVLQPNGKLFFQSSVKMEGNTGVRFTAGKSSGEPYLLLGQAGGSRLEARQFILEGGAGLVWDSGKNEAGGTFKVGGAVKGGKLVIDFSQADGFLGQILSGIGLESNFDLGIGFTSKDGLFFHGSSALEIQLPSHIDLGPVQIDAITFSVGIEGTSFPIGLSANVGINVGPLQGIVEQIGVKAFLSIPPDRKGNAGPLQFDLGFKPPNGLGLSINAGAVIGGGYLFFDFEKEEYAGVMELTIAGFISAKAIGLITTKMPDGSKGFSMLIIITAEFMPPFQLSYGFTLIGVGGLLGLNRTVLLDPLRDAVRTGAVTSIMFPQNVIANAPRIISDLKTIFPPHEGKFLIGPMAKLGWGTPTLISLSLGLIIEIPGNIAILGILKVALPEERIPLIQIQVLFVGTIDFDKKMLTFDASLYESFILTMTIEGDMAVRLKWGDDPDFILTVGGFHPSYTPPPLVLPTLRRLAINILNTPIAKIRVECYQAITSNTVQFGARADLYFDVSVCSITGFISFDALFQLSPFHFIVEVAAGFSLSAAGISVMSVRVRMSLEGPTPWRARGTGSVSLLFFEISADFDVTWGEEKNTALPDIAILQTFIDEIKKKELWSTALSANKNLLVSLRKFNDIAEADSLVMHPAGSLVVQQKLLPLTVKFDKIGNQKTNDVQKIAITEAHSSGVPLTVKDVDENFARAQYQNLSDAEKLSKPSFEKMPGGVSLSLGETTIKNGKLVRKKVKYETTIIDKEPVKRKKGLFFKPIGILFDTFLKGNSVSKSTLSKNYAQKFQPFDEKMHVMQEGYTVAFQANNQAFNIGATFKSEMMAQTFMQDQIAKNPSLQKEVHIILTSELQEL